MRISGQKLDRIIREELQRELLNQGLITERRDLLQEGWFTDLLGGFWDWLSGLFGLEGGPSNNYQRAMQKIFKDMSHKEMLTLADMFDKLAQHPQTGKLSIREMLRLFESEKVQGLIKARAEFKGSTDEFVNAAAQQAAADEEAKEEADREAASKRALRNRRDAERKGMKFQK